MFTTVRQQMEELEVLLFLKSIMSRKMWRHYKTVLFRDQCPKNEPQSGSNRSNWYTEKWRYHHPWSGPLARKYTHILRSEIFIFPFTAKVCSSEIIKKSSCKLKPLTALFRMLPYNPVTITSIYPVQDKNYCFKNRKQL